jgi:hypothetical protein
MSQLNQAAADIAKAESRLGNQLNENINNRGTRVDAYLRYAGSLPANPATVGPMYCGMFVFWCYGQASLHANVPNPLPRDVFGGRQFRDWAMTHSNNIVYRSGGSEPILEAGDVFVVSNLTHVGMVVAPIQDFAASGRSNAVTHGFISVEGNQADMVENPEWGPRGVRQKHVRLTSCALIYRP